MLCEKFSPSGKIASNIIAIPHQAIAVNEHLHFPIDNIFEDLRRLMSAVGSHPNEHLLSGKVVEAVDG